MKLITQEGRAAIESAGEIITLAIVEDEPLLRDLLRVALSQNPGLQVVGVFGDGESALEAIPALQPKVALMDIELGGGLSGIQVGLLLREQLPGIGVVLLSNHWIPRFIAALPSDVMAGWCYLLKKSLSDTAALGRAIEGAASGLVVLDPYIVAGRQPREGSRLAGLTPRQREILALISQGFTNSAIAQRLNLSPSTIENQLNQLYQELRLVSGHNEFNARVRAALLYVMESQVAEIPGV